MNRTDEHTLDVLDYRRLRELLAGYCVTPMGRERMLGLLPFDSATAVEAEFDRLEEVMALPEEPALGAVADVRHLCPQLRAGATLGGRELAVIRQALVGAIECRAFLERNGSRLRHLRALSSRLAVLPELVRAIETTVDDSGSVLDTASVRLNQLRAEARRYRDLIVGRLETLMERHPDWFNGSVTVRGERFVVPLLLERRQNLPGVVHASSGSGQTLFVEPLEAVALGNELAELRDAETEEVARILRDLSSRAAAVRVELEETMAAVAELDCLFARRRFAQRQGCIRPLIDPDRGVEIVNGRHPLLVRRGIEVVPLSLRIEPDKRVLLVSGPNAGGKTVVLKTVGLFALMTASGIPIPAGEGTRLPFFKRVFADIGDEQSLDDNLSSFTAHLRRLAEMLASADADCLVLADEIGASTSPEEGAALALAVLEELRDRGVLTLATTHYGTLKLLVQNEPGMLNAAMEYRNGPTYRLKVGYPGDSAALDTAAAAGVPNSVVMRARERLGRQWQDFEAKLRALDEELAAAQALRRRAELALQQAESEKQAAMARINAQRAELESARQQLRREEEYWLRERRREIENLVREIRLNRADHRSVVAAKQAVSDSLAELAAVPTEPTTIDKIPVVGDTVESATFRRQGQLVASDGERATVAFGNIRIEVALSDLQRVEPARPVPASPQPPVEFEFQPRLSLIGMTSSEAEAALGRFLDDAALAGCRELEIVHGRGSGVLRRTVWRCLRNDSRVQTLQFAEPARGGDGVSLVVLKDEAAPATGKSAAG